MNGKYYLIMCRNKREAACLYERMCIYLEDNGIGARGFKSTFTIDIMGSHNMIVFRTVRQVLDGCRYDELVTSRLVDKFLDAHESSKEAARITDAMNDML